MYFESYVVSSAKRLKFGSKVSPSCSCSAVAASVNCEMWICKKQQYLRCLWRKILTAVVLASIASVLNRCERDWKLVSIWLKTKFSNCTHEKEEAVTAYCEDVWNEMIAQLQSYSYISSTVHSYLAEVLRKQRFTVINWWHRRCMYALVSCLNHRI